MEEGAQSASPSPADLPQRKLARQLDFTAAAAAAASIHVAIEKPPMSLAVPRPSFTVPVPMRPDSSLPRVLPLLEAREARDGTPKKPKTCNCKNSKCLKLYCECFASGFYCNGCNCLNCYNNIENEASRQEAIEASLDRNPNAFRPKIECSPNAIPDREEAGELHLVGKHNKGCHCKKSGCLKKYCECFQAGILCSENCKCLDCKNFEGSEERRALSHGDLGNIPTHIQQTNAALNGAIGPSGYGSPPAYKKRKTQEHFIGTISKDQANLRIAQFPHMARGTNLPLQGSSKGTYRSLLADIVQPKDLKDLCKLLMVVSHEAAKKGSDQKSQQKPTDREDQIACSLASSSEPRDERQKEIQRQGSSVGDHSTTTLAEKMSTESGSDFTDVQKGGRPMSPGTLALMCDEKDTMFMTSQNNNALPRFMHNRNMSEGYVEQESTVLTEFKDCLWKLIACGRDKETSCSSKVTKPESDSHHEPFVNAPTSSTEVARTVNAFPSSPSKFLPPKSGRQHIENGNKRHKEIIDVD